MYLMGGRFDQIRTDSTIGGSIQPAAVVAVLAVVAMLVAMVHGARGLEDRVRRQMDADAAVIGATSVQALALDANAVINHAILAGHALELGVLMIGGGSGIGLSASLVMLPEGLSIIAESIDLFRELVHLNHELASLRDTMNESLIPGATLAMSSAIGLRQRSIPFPYPFRPAGSAPSHSDKDRCKEAVRQIAQGDLPELAQAPGGWELQVARIDSPHAMAAGLYTLGSRWLGGQRGASSVDPELMDAVGDLEDRFRATVEQLTSTSDEGWISALSPIASRYDEIRNRTATDERDSLPAGRELLEWTRSLIARHQLEWRRSLVRSERDRTSGELGRSDNDPAVLAASLSSWSAAIQGLRGAAVATGNTDVERKANGLLDQILVHALCGASLVGRAISPGEAFPMPTFLPPDFPDRQRFAVAALRQAETGLPNLATAQGRPAIAEPGYGEPILQLGHQPRVVGVDVYTDWFSEGPIRELLDAVVAH